MTEIAQKISKRLTKESYASEEVRRHLEKFARLLTRKHNPRVYLSSHRTAATKHGSDGLEIVITNDKIKQPVTNINEDAWQLLAREALLIHEIGHVLYTDFDAHERILDRVPMGEKQAFHKIYNATEDAVIDQQLRWKFNCGKELDTHLANLFMEGDPIDLDLLGAVHVAILEKGVYSTGKLDEYRNGNRQLVQPRFEDEFDEALEMVDDLLADTMSEPNADKRYERMYQFWQDLKDLHPEVENQTGGNRDMSDMIPDDTTGMTPGQDADELEDVNPEDVKEMVVEIGKPPEPEEADEDGEPEAGEEELDLGELFGEPDDEADEDGEGSEGDEEHEHGESDSEAGEEPGEDEQAGSGNGGEETGEDADSDGSGEEGDAPATGGGNGIPGHEGHSLVIRD